MAVLIYQQVQKVAKLFAFILLSLSLHINAAEKTVTLCTLDNWPPYAGQDLPKHGYAVQIVDEAFALQGYQVIRRWLPWKRVVVEAKEGERCNGASEIYHTKEREKWFGYTNSYGAVRMMIFAKKSRNLSYKKIVDLAPYKVGFLRGSAISDEFDQADFLNKTEVNTHKQGLEMLYANRLDLLASEEMSVKSLINKSKSHYNINNDVIEVLEPELNINRFHLGFSKKDKSNIERISAFNIGLDKLKASGRYEAIVKEHGLD